jgi:hypothetical protein
MRFTYRRVRAGATLDGTPGCESNDRGVDPTVLIPKLLAILEGVYVAAYATVFLTTLQGLWRIRVGFQMASFLTDLVPLVAADLRHQVDDLLVHGVAVCVYSACGVGLSLVACTGLWRATRVGAYASLLLSVVALTATLAAWIAGFRPPTPSVGEVARACAVGALVARPVWRALR